jgi:hypothetical protein
MHTKKMFGNLMVLSLIGFITAGCSDAGASVTDCSEYEKNVQVLYDDFAGIGWNSLQLKSYSGRNYANFVLSAPEGCTTTEEIAKAKTLLMTIDDANN